MIKTIEVNDTGISRKIDEVGRIVIPSDLKKRMGVSNGDYVEIYLTEDNQVLLKKKES